MAESPQAQFQQSQRYIVTRQSELSLLPTYTPGVSESYVDRWRLIVAPLSIVCKLAGEFQVFRQL